VSRTAHGQVKARAARADSLPAVPESTTPATVPGLLARQPLLDGAGRIAGQQLTFRGAGGPATDAVAALALGSGDHTLAALTGGVPAWIRVSKAFLLEFDPLPVAPGRVVLELDSATPVDDELLKRLARLHVERHRLALDDFLPSEATEPLVPFADHVKVDLKAYSLAGVSAVRDRLPERAPGIVVTNVDSPRQADSCLKRGAALLQGFFFEQPRPAGDRPVPAGSISRLQALVAMRGAPSFEDVERIVAGDPGLTVRLLRFANSAAVGAGRRLSSVREALVLLGSEQVRQFVLLVLLGEMGEGRPALVAAGVLRGRLCEAIARDLRLADPTTAFTAGVLSVVDALLDQKLFDVLRTLPVTEELRWALLGHSGPVGAVLAMAIQLEQNRRSEAARRFEGFESAVSWADTAVSGLV
jgi:EAL and modified HD-GYP domain-containing signal transduction protein